MRVSITFPDGRQETHDIDVEVIRIGSAPESEILVEGLPPTCARLIKRRGRNIVQPLENSEVLVNGKRILLPKPVSPKDTVVTGPISLSVLDKGAPLVSSSAEGEVDRDATHFLEIPDEIVPKLKVLNGPLAGETFDLIGSAIIGRDPSVDITLDDKFISRQHARVYTDENGEVVITDLGGKNPIFVNEHIVRLRRLRNGDRVQIGNTKLLYTLLSEAETDEEEFMEPRRSRLPLVAALAAVVAVGGLVTWFLVSRNRPNLEVQASALMIQADHSTNTHERAELYAEAAALYTELAKRSPNAEPTKRSVDISSRSASLWELVAEGQDSLKVGNYTAAAAVASKALRLDETNEEAARVKFKAIRMLTLEANRNDAGESLARGDYAEALMFAELAREISPEDGEAGRIADSSLAMLKRTKKRGSVSARAEAVGRLRRAYDVLHDLAVAESLITEYKAAYPRDASIEYYASLVGTERKARQQEEEGNAERALALWYKLLELDPSNRLALRKIR